MKHTITYRLSNTPIISYTDKRLVTKAYKHRVRTAPFHVMFYVLEGQLPIVEDGTEYLLQEGTLFFLKAGVQHWGEHYIPVGTLFVFVHFHLLDADRKELPQREYEPTISLAANRVNAHEFKETVVTLPKRIDHLGGSDLERSICHLAEFYHEGDAFRALKINAMLMNIFADCMQLKYKENITTTEIRIQEILSYLQAHRNEAFRAQEIAEHMGLSYKYMEEGFKKRTGMTIQQYHTSLRIHEAEQMLRATSAPIAEISEKLGYQDPLYFSNVFKKATGMSPRNYRQNIGLISIE